MKILFAADQSKYSSWAADFLLRLPLTEPPLIQALHVIEKAVLTDPLIAPALVSQTTREAQKATTSANRLTKRLADRLCTRWQTVRPQIERGPITEKIISVARKDKSDLIMMGSRGLSDVQAFLMGSVSQQVVTYAPCSVLVVKRKISKLKKILVAVDGSVEARRAMAFLANHLSPAQIDVTLLNVRNDPFIPPTFSLETLKDHVRDSFALGHTLLDEAGFATQDLCVIGHSAAKIVETARRRRADLVVVGSRGLTGLKRFLLGSVSRQVIKHSPCAVLVVRGRQLRW